MALRSRARALLRGPEIQLLPTDVEPIAGRARLGRKTKALVKRLRPGDIAVIDHADVDRIAAEDLVASGVSVEYPSAPCTWIERSMTRPSMFATKCFAIDTSDLKSRPPSIRYAAWSTINLAW